MDEKNNESKSRPFFTVVVATYNRADLLKRALRSLLLQTENSWEAIIIDDGSTDETKQVVDEFQEQSSNFFYFKQDNQGCAKAKNRGIKNANGVYITFLDSDDEYLSNHLKLRKQTIDKNKDVQFLFGGVEIIGNPYVPDCFSPDREIHLSKCAISGSFFMHRSLCEKVDGFKNLNLAMDKDLFDRIMSINVSTMQIADRTYIYHHENTDSMTNNHQV